MESGRYFPPPQIPGTCLTDVTWSCCEGTWPAVPVGLMAPAPLVPVGAGVVLGGVPAGGVPVGGVPAGGLAVGGEPAGGVAVGGVPAGGVVLGGVPAGGGIVVGGVAGVTPAAPGSVAAPVGCSVP